MKTDGTWQMLRLKMTWWDCVRGLTESVGPSTRMIRIRITGDGESRNWLIWFTRKIAVKRCMWVQSRTSLHVRRYQRPERQRLNTVIWTTTELAEYRNFCRCQSRAMEQFTATSQRCWLTVQSVPAVTKDIFVWTVGPWRSANYFCGDI